MATKPHGPSWRVWLVLGLLPVLSLSTPLASAGAAHVADGDLAAKFVRACGTGLCLDDLPFALYGATMYHEFDHLDWVSSSAQELHLNTIRLVNMFPQPYRGDPERMARDETSWQKADRAIATFGSLGLHVTLDLSDYRNYLVVAANQNAYTVDWGPFLGFVANRVNTITGVRYADDPTIALVAFAGEVEAPTRTTHGVTTQQLNDFYARTFAEWRSFDHNHLLTTGGLSNLNWKSGIDWRTIMALPQNDVCAIHIYSDGDLNITTPAIADYCAQLGKPWITEEFGVCRKQFFSDADRAARAQLVYAALQQYNSAGVIVWNLGDQGSERPTTCDVNANFPLTYGVVQSNAPR